MRLRGDRRHRGPLQTINLGVGVRVTAWLLGTSQGGGSSGVSLSSSAQSLGAESLGLLLTKKGVGSGVQGLLENWV